MVAHILNVEVPMNSNKLQLLFAAFLIYLILSLTVMSHLYFQMWASSDKFISLVIIFFAQSIIGTVIGVVTGLSMKGSHHTKTIKIIAPVVLIAIVSYFYYYDDTFLQLFVKLFTVTKASTKYHQFINILSLIIYIAFYTGSVLWSTIRYQKNMRSN